MYFRAHTSGGPGVATTHLLIRIDFVVSEPIALLPLDAVPLNAFVSHDVDEVAPPLMAAFAATQAASFEE